MKVRILFTTIVIYFLLTLSAFGQVTATVDGPATIPAADPTSDILMAVMAALGFVGAMVARWTQTNAALPWYVRLARVFDVTQVVDSTRKLDD